MAEATALTYAALRVRGIDSRIHGLLESLKARFFVPGTVSSADYTHSLTHRCLGAMVFGDAHALQDITVFRRCERIPHYGIEGISAYSQISSDLSVSIEASAQLALAWSSCTVPVHTDFNDLLTNLLILQTKGHKHPGTVGLPRAVPAPSASTSMVVPAVEPTCYLLFTLWRYNPFALF